MKDLNSLKRELKRLADVNKLKKELNRLATEIKNFDVRANLTPQARQRLDLLEERFRDLLKMLAELQKEVDKNVSKFLKIVRGTKSTVRKAAKKKTARRKTAKKSRKAS